MTKQSYGRPRKPLAMRRTEQHRIHLSVAEKRLLVKAAAKVGRDVSGWARDLLVGQAKKVCEVRE